MREGISDYVLKEIMTWKKSEIRLDGSCTPAAARRSDSGRRWKATFCHWHGPRQCKAIKERRTSGTAITYNPEDRVLVRPIRPALLDQLLAETAARNLTAVLSACSSHKSQKDPAGGIVL